MAGAMAAACESPHTAKPGDGRLRTPMTQPMSALAAGRPAARVWLSEKQSAWKNGLRSLLCRQHVLHCAGRRPGTPSRRRMTSPVAAASTVIVVAATNTWRREAGQRPCRTGCSMSRHDSAARTNETAIADGASAPVRAWPRRCCRNTITGQCHRYSEYETSPTSTRGRQDSARLTGLGVPPATMTRAAPRHGSKAAVPGNGVSSDRPSSAAAIRSSPSSPPAADCHACCRPGSASSPAGCRCPAPRRARAADRRRCPAPARSQRAPSTKEPTSSAASTPSAAAGCQPVQADQQQRKQHVELLLDAERPGVQQRLETGVGVEIAGFVPEPDVRREHGRKRHAAADTTRTRAA